MKYVMLFIILGLTVIAIADDAEDEPKAITDDVGLEINHCHPGDSATIHVIPIPKNERRREGWFTTTNTILALPDLSMLPEGLNRLNIKPICRGLTGEVTSVVIDLQRPPPRLKLGVAIVKKPVSTNSPVPLRMTARTGPEWPPMPPGMLERMPLPGGATNHGTYKDLELMRKYFETTKRRSQ